MTKLKVTLLLAAFAVTVANPAFAHCGGHKFRQAAVAVKKPAMAVRTEPAAQATEAAPLGLSTDLVGG